MWQKRMWYNEEEYDVKADDVDSMSDGDSSNGSGEWNNCGLNAISYDGRLRTGGILIASQPLHEFRLWRLRVLATKGSHRSSFGR